MLTITVKGQCPECHARIAFSADALTDAEPKLLPREGDFVIVAGGLWAVVAREDPDALELGTSATVTMRLERIGDSA